VEGVEPNPHAASYARKRHGLTVHDGDLAQAGLPESSFDVITAWNVLEHMHDPLSNLREMSRLLRPGGLLVFSIPNMDSLEAGLFGHYWLGWELPRHLYFFSRPVMEEALRTSKFELVKWDCLVGAYPSFLFSLRFMLAAKAGRARWAQLVWGAARSVPARAAAAPIFWLLTKANMATLITGFARREVATTH
jgi:SAM-dependent methyltransferase